jgi:hypothetical protein
MKNKSKIETMKVVDSAQCTSADVTMQVDNYLLITLQHHRLLQDMSTELHIPPTAPLYIREIVGDDGDKWLSAVR